MWLLTVNSVCSQASSSLNSGAVIKPLKPDFYRSDAMKTHTFVPINANQIRASAQFFLKRWEVYSLKDFFPRRQLGRGSMGFCDVEGLQPAVLKLHQRLGKLSFSEPLTLLNQMTRLVELGTFPAHTSLGSPAKNLNHWSSYEKNELSIRYVSSTGAKPASV